MLRHRPITSVEMLRTVAVRACLAAAVALRGGNAIAVDFELVDAVAPPAPPV